MTWLDDVTSQHSELESPKNFWLWSALVSISAIVKDNVWLNRGGAYSLYPNIYCIFHAESGLKKGPPINLARRLVSTVNNTKIISGRSSIQGIMKELGTAETRPGGKIETKSTAFICSSELSSSIVEDSAALTILTDLYDRIYYEGEWSSLLKMEKFKLFKPTVTLLGGINDAHAEEFFNKKDIQGGFLARTFIIYEKEAQTINSLMKKLTNPPDTEKLSLYLRELGKLKGPFEDTFDENNNYTPVGRFYDDWYHDFTNARKKSGIKDDTGTLNRFGDSLLKIAMLISLAREPSLVLTIPDIEQAIVIGEKLIGNIKRTTMGKRAMSTSAPLKVKIIYLLLERETHSISRAHLAKELYLHYGSITELEELMVSMAEAKLIQITNQGSQTIYTMPDSEVERIKKMLEGREQS